MERPKIKSHYKPPKFCSVCKREVYQTVHRSESYWADWYMTNENRNPKKDFNNNHIKGAYFFNIEKISNGLKLIGYEINSKTQIIPIIVGDEKTAMEFGKYLLENGIFAQPIRYPTVSHNNARIRISMNARLTDVHITKSLSVSDNRISSSSLLCDPPSPPPTKAKEMDIPCVLKSFIALTTCH